MRDLEVLLGGKSGGQNLRRQGTQILVIDVQQGCMALIARDGRFTDADWGRV